METADNQAKIDAAADVTDRMLMGAVSKLAMSGVRANKENMQICMDEMFTKIASPFFADRAELREWFEKGMIQIEERTRAHFANLKTLTP